MKPMPVLALLGCICITAISVTGVLAAEEPALPDAARVPVALPAVPVDELAVRLKESLLKNLAGSLLFENSRNWGHQVKDPDLDGLKVVRVPRNHGTWEKARVYTWQLPKYLSVRVDNLHSPDDSQLVFTAHLTAPATVELNKQIWQDGVELYSARVRARCQLSAAVTLAATVTPAGKDGLACRQASVQIADATFTCNHFVTENVNGVGGDIARLANVQRRFKPWQPQVLGELQTALLAAMQTASTASEVRAGLNQVLGQALATRSAILQMQGTVQRWQLPAQTPTLVAAIPPTPVVLCGGVTIPIPVWLEPVHHRPHEAEPVRHGPQAAAVPSPHNEHWNLSTYSLHYESRAHAAHASDTAPAAHHGDVHKK